MWHRLLYDLILNPLGEPARELKYLGYVCKLQGQETILNFLKNRSLDFWGMHNAIKVWMLDQLDQSNLINFFISIKSHREMRYHAYCSCFGSLPFCESSGATLSRNTMMVVAPEVKLADAELALQQRPPCPARSRVVQYILHLLETYHLKSVCVLRTMCLSQRARYWRWTNSTTSFAWILDFRQQFLFLRFISGIIPESSDYSDRAKITADKIISSSYLF